MGCFRSLENIFFTKKGALKMKNKNTIDLKYILVTIFAVLFTWIAHEFCHWITGRCLGYPMAMTLNSAYVDSPSGNYNHDWEHQVSSAAGPIFTIFQAITVYYIMKHRDIPILYSTLFICFLCRFGATMLSFKPNNFNDEARISHFLGIGDFTLPIIVTLFLLTLVVLTVRRYQFSAKFVFLNFLMTGFLIYSLVRLHDIYHWRLI
jgi:hypothetical protein